MYKIKSTVGEVKELYLAYAKECKVKVKKRRVYYIHKHINDRTFFGKRKFKSVKDVVRYMQNTAFIYGTIWDDLSIINNQPGVIRLCLSINNLPDEREIWLDEDMSFLFMYKGVSK